MADPDTSARLARQTIGASRMTVAALRGLGGALLAALLSAAGTPGALAQGNAKDGETVFKKCVACHDVGPTAKNKVGPTLNGIVGRKAGTVAGFAYSEANRKAGEQGWTWTDDVMLKYLDDPRAAMPGNKMAFAGLKDEQDRKDVLAYLKTFAAAAGTAPAVATAAKPATAPAAPQVSAAAAPAAASAAPSTTTAPASELPAEIFVAGTAPSERPSQAPRVKALPASAEWYRRALTGLSEPYPSSFHFLEDQGGWYSPFDRPGMTGPYDLRNWHQR